MQFLPYVFVALLILAGIWLKHRQDRTAAAAPRIPCDRCGRATPAGDLYRQTRPDGFTIELCERCEWPNGI